SLYWGEYAKHKIAGENALLERHRRRGLPVTLVRPTHVYGPLNTRNNETFFFDRILRGRPVLVPGAGGWLRQFGHVEDLADAMTAMLGEPRAAGPPGAAPRAWTRPDRGGRPSPPTPPGRGPRPPRAPCGRRAAPRWSAATAPRPPPAASRTPRSSTPGPSPPTSWPARGGSAG